MSKDTQNTNTLVKDPALAQVTNDELLALHTAQGEVLGAQQKTIEEQEQKIATLEAALADMKASRTADAAPKGGTIVKIGNAEYQVLHGLRREGRTLSAADIAADQKLCKALVEEGSGALKKL